MEKKMITRPAIKISELQEDFQPADLPVVVLYNMDRTWSQEDQREVLNLTHELEAGLSVVGHSTQSVCLEDEKFELAMLGCDPDHQIVFNWCEEIPGIPHSGSLVAHKLESLGFTFTGADSKALLFSQDKPAVKEQLVKQQVPTPRWMVYECARDIDWDSFPAIVKPAYEHYSLGITREAVVHSRKELISRIARVIDAFHQPVLVEDFIGGREFHVSVVGNGKLDVLPIAEMDFSAIPNDRAKLCSYDSKFIPSSSDYQLIQLRLPASLTEEEKFQLEAVSISAYRAADCRDYARLDIRQRDGIFFVLDVNPNADLSPDTSLVMSAELAGYTFGQFCSLLVKLAAHRHPAF
jgi:D-alanine-D-alanine ligase